ncbi:stage III sporulation protein AE [Anaerospora sp.]|uniref:stage III sporulation protein AE n=1 Tax=Anaerospora sp. TaxID=1960278 RepID=UPI00289E5CD6|nr:stage III sporulation protein AE [Anaerospora sp.]MDF2927853.1 stage sporulation protein [Anaerospora sp.]
MRIVFITIMLLMNCYICVAASPETDELSMKLFNTLSADNINQFISNINHELNEDIPMLSPQTIKDIASNGLAYDWQKLTQSLMARLFKELAANIHLMGKLLFLAVLCALLQNLQNSFESSAISVLAYGICFVFLTVIALTAFYNALGIVRQTVQTMIGFMEALLPLLISLLAGMGAITSATLFTPLMLFVINTVSVIVRDIVLPLLFLTGVLECVNYLSDKYRLNNLASVFKQTSMIILGLTMVIFIGIISIQGVTGSVADGLTLRTAKFATATFIPVVGKMFADTVELVMGASLLLKNAVGVFGVLVIILLCILPVIKLISLILIIKVAGALIEPMGDEKMAKCLDGIGNNLLLVFGALLTVALMLFLAITMIIGAGSMALMLR